MKFAGRLRLAFFNDQFAVIFIFLLAGGQSIQSIYSSTRVVSAVFFRRGGPYPTLSSQSQPNSSHATFNNLFTSCRVTRLTLWSYILQVHQMMDEPFNRYFEKHFSPYIVSTAYKFVKRALQACKGVIHVSVSTQHSKGLSFHPAHIYVDRKRAFTFSCLKFCYYICIYKLHNSRNFPIGK